VSTCLQKPAALTSKLLPNLGRFGLVQAHSTQGPLHFRSCANFGQNRQKSLGRWPHKK